MPEMEVTEQDILQLRDLTGVESAEYELDGVAYWTDAQLAEVLLLTAWTLPPRRSRDDSAESPDPLSQCVRTVMGGGRSTP